MYLKKGIVHKFENYLYQEAHTYSKEIFHKKFTEQMEKECKEFVKKFLIQINDSRTEDGVIDKRIYQELNKNVKENVWINYLQDIKYKKKIKGINWIDLESKISQIVETIDREEENLYAPIPNSIILEDDKIRTFREKIQMRLKGNVLEYTYKDLLDVTYEDLRKLVRCLKIYLVNCVEKENINFISPDIQKLELD